MFAMFLVLLLVVLGNCGGTSITIDPRSQKESWPLLGLNLCNMLVHMSTKENCIKCFKDTASWIEGSACVSEWLPQRFAACVNGIKPGHYGVGDQKKFEACLRKAENYQRAEKKRATVLYKKGSTYLARVGDSKIVKDGGAAMFACMAQELLVNDDNLQAELDVSAGTCFNRFQMDPVNEQWHLHKGDRPQYRKSSQILPKKVDDQSGSQLEKKSKSNAQTNRLGVQRNLVYEYGYVGHDMPFHGIGPFAVDILKGECIFNSMDEYGDLDELAHAVINSDVPVAPWIFREILNKITSINLP